MLGMCYDESLPLRSPVAKQQNNNNRIRGGNRGTRRAGLARTNPGAGKRLQGLPDGGMLIHHREFCGTLNHETSKPAYHHPDSNEKVSASPFKLPINPGDGRTFPWLAGLSGRFEKYRFRSLKFSYQPTCSTLENGGVALCPIYDPADPVPTSRSDLMNAEGAARGAVYRPLNLSVPSSKMRHNDTMYIREFHEELVDEAELRTTDLGYIAAILTDTNTAETDSMNYGDIFVEYN